MIKTLINKVSVFKRMPIIWLFLCLLLCPSISIADSFTLDLGEAGPSGSMMGRVIQIFLLITIISLAPMIVVVVTSFTRFVVVFSFLRTPMGTQQSPPNMILVSLALFLTIFVMQPTLEKIYTQAIDPLISGKIDEKEAFEKASPPLKSFMLKNVREDDLRLFLDIANVDKLENPDDTPLHALVPAFLISELRRSFEIGFLLFIPFLIIDMVVASVLMAMGMMMLPPVMISMPFKIIFFVLIDGWHLLCGSLIKSVST